eukprot:458652_1
MDSTPLLVHSASNPKSTILSRDPDSNDTLSQKATVAVPAHGANYSSTDTSNKLLQPTYYGAQGSSACMSIPDDDGDRTVNTESSFSYFSSAFGGPLATYEACERTITGVSEFLIPRLIQVRRWGFLTALWCFNSRCNMLEEDEEESMEDPIERI